MIPIEQVNQFDNQREQMEQKKRSSNLSTPAFRKNKDKSGMEDRAQQAELTEQCFRNYNQRLSSNSLEQRLEMVRQKARSRSSKLKFNYNELTVPSTVNDGSIAAPQSRANHDFKRYNTVSYELQPEASNQSEPVMEVEWLYKKSESQPDLCSEDKVDYNL